MMRWLAIALGDGSRDFEAAKACRDGLYRRLHAFDAVDWLHYAYFLSDIYDDAIYRRCWGDGV